MGYIIAGAIVDKLTNKTYEDVFMERVIKPLGITTAGFGPMGTVGLEDQPLQHSINYAPVEPDPGADIHPIYNPAGRLHMSIGHFTLNGSFLLLLGTKPCCIRKRQIFY